MSMKKRVRTRQRKCGVVMTHLPAVRQSPILHAMNQRLAEHYFDDFAEGQGQPFSAEIMGRRPCSEE
jgi:hypothetical protein